MITTWKNLKNCEEFEINKRYRTINTNFFDYLINNALKFEKYVSAEQEAYITPCLNCVYEYQGFTEKAI